jgi:hypothetical protein
LHTNRYTVGILMGVHLMGIQFIHPSSGGTTLFSAKYDSGHR